LILAVFCLAGHLRVAGFRDTVIKGAVGRTRIHAAPLMGPPSVVALEIVLCPSECIHSYGESSALLADD
jgi:hypothetical protein